VVATEVQGAVVVTTACARSASFTVAVNCKVGFCVP